jgi:hypothetical protein
MANGDLGEYYSILGTAQQTRFNAQQKQRDEERRKDRRDRYIGYFAKPLLGAIGEEVTDIIKSPFEEKYADFKNSKFAVEQRVKDQAAERAATLFDDVDKQARKAGELDKYNTYFTQGLREKVMSGMIAKGIDKAAIDGGFYNTAIEEQVSLLAQDEVDRHIAKGKAVATYKATGSFSSVQSDFNRRPKGVLGTVVNWARGRSAEEIDAEAEEKWKKSDARANREALLLFEEAKAGGVSRSEAYNLAIEAVSNKDNLYYKDTVLEITSSKRNDMTGEYVISTKTETYNPSSPEGKLGKPVSSKTTEVVQSTEKAQKFLEDKLVKESLTIFNYGLQAQTHLNTEGLTEWQRLAKEKGINTVRPKTMEELEELDTIWQSLQQDADKYFKATRTPQEIKQAQEFEVLTTLVVKDEGYQQAVNEQAVAQKAYDTDPTGKNKEKLDKTTISVNNNFNRVLNAVQAVKEEIYGKAISSATPPATTAVPPASSGGIRGAGGGTPGATVPPAGTAPPKEGDKRINSKGEPIIYKNGKWVANDGSI